MPLQCSFDGQEISLGEHLARRRAGVGSCRRCANRDRLTLLSSTQAERLAAAARQASASPEVSGDTILCRDRNALPAKLVRRLATRFGIDRRRATRARFDESRSIVLGCDGRSIVWELAAAAGEGLVLAAIDVIDVGTVSGPALLHAMHAERAAGAVLIGSPDLGPASVGMTFWSADQQGLPCPVDESLLHASLTADETPIARPSRRGGRTRRLDIGPTYIASLTPLFHGLRPLNIVVSCSDATTWRYLDEMLARTAIRVTRLSGDCNDVVERIAAVGADLGVCVSDNGRHAAFLDNAGNAVHAASLADLLVRPRTDTTAKMSDPMWPDALRSLGELLQVLSRSDRPLSTVLDAPDTLD